MQKLIKLSDTHYVVVDDSEIKEGDYCIPKARPDLIWVMDKNKLLLHNNGECTCLKILYSTQPNKGMENVTFISLSEVEEAINGYSVEKMGEDATNLRILKHKTPNQVARQYFDGYVDGFNDYKELVKDKLFTDNKQLKPLQNLLDEGYDPYDSAHHLQVQRMLKIIEAFMQALLPKTEWEVEITPEGKIVLL